MMGKAKKKMQNMGLSNTQRRELIFIFEIYAQKILSNFQFVDENNETFGSLILLLYG